jgi:hypothetical protein
MEPASPSCSVPGVLLSIAQKSGFPEQGGRGWPWGGSVGTFLLAMSILLPGTREAPWVFTLYNSLSSPFMGYSIFGICVIFHNKKV